MTTWTGNGWEMRAGRWQDSPPEGVDVIISDPPFTDRVSENAKPRMGLLRLPKRERHGTSGLSFPGINPAEVGPALVRLTMRWVVLFCAVEQVGEYAAACSRAYVRGGWWQRTNPTPQFTGDRPGTPGDAIAVLHRPGCKRWNGGGRALSFSGAQFHGVAQRPEDEPVHETQKPLWLMRELVSLFSEPGEMVWDPYAGSATTGVACLQLGRRFLGHEIQDRYAEVAVERLRAAEGGQTLREARAGQLRLFEDSAEKS